MPGNARNRAQARNVSRKNEVLLEFRKGIFTDSSYFFWSLQSNLGLGLLIDRLLLILIRRGWGAAEFIQCNTGPRRKLRQLLCAVRFSVPVNATPSTLAAPVAHRYVVPTPARQHLTSGQIFDFAWSRDGKQLLLAKGEETSDVLLISNFR
jgi:hypothetical protein